VVCRPIISNEPTTPSGTVTEILPHLQWPRPFQGQFIVRRLRLAVANPHTKFEVSMITCNEDMKGNAKLFSLALTAEALLSEICQIGVFWRVGHFERKFQVDGDVVGNPSMDR